MRQAPPPNDFHVVLIFHKSDQQFFDVFVKFAKRRLSHPIVLSEFHANHANNDKSWENLRCIRPFKARLQENIRKTENGFHQKFPSIHLFQYWFCANVI